MRVPRRWQGWEKESARLDDKEVHRKLRASYLVGEIGVGEGEDGPRGGGAGIAGLFE
jgi:hypothetical protein